MNPQLGEALLVLFPAAVPNVDYVVQDDGDGPYIAVWNLSEPQPTEAEVDAAVLLIPAHYATKSKEAAKAILDSDDPAGRVQRGTISNLAAELNGLRAWVQSMRAALETTNAFPQFRATALSGLPVMPDTTPELQTDAIKTAIDAEA